MDPMTILSVAGMAFTAARQAYEAGEALGRFINDVKYIDQTISLLVTEVKALSAACELVGSRIQGIVEAMDGVGKDKDKGIQSESPLWIQVRTQLQDCADTISALYEEVKDVGLEKKKTKNPFSQAWRQIQLNMKSKDIEEARNRIRSHTASLQLVLQAITLELSYIGPHRADQQLLVLLESIRDIKQELSLIRHSPHSDSDFEKQHDQKEDELIKYTEKIISSGETLYEGSIAGGSVIGPTEGLDEKITSWVSRLQILSSDTATTTNDMDDWDTHPGSSVSGADIGTVTDITSDSGMEARPKDFDDMPAHDMPADEDEGDGLDIEMIKEAYELVVVEFHDKDYVKASMLLQEVLTMVEESPVRGRTIDLRELRWMLAVCAYHTEDFQAAEAALKEIVQLPPQGQGQDDRLRLCEAGHILALATLKQGKLSEARQYCDSALQGRRRLLGKQDKACYQSLALLARIFELQNSARAAIYARMIPEDQREEICAEFKTIGVPVASSSTELLVRDDKAEVKDKELPPLPPGPPPYIPSAEEDRPPSASSLPSPQQPPEQRWKFRPPIPTKPPPEVESPKAESSDEETVFPPEKMQEKVSSIVRSNTSPLQSHSAAGSPLERVTTEPMSGASRAAQAPSYAGSRPAVPVPPPSTLSRTTSISSVQQQEAEKQVDIAVYKEESIRAQKRHGKKSVPAQNALHMYATTVHGMDMRRADAQKCHEDLIKPLKDNFDEGHELMSQTYANLAKIAEDKGDFNKSSDYYQKVLDARNRNASSNATFNSTVQGQLTEISPTFDKPTFREELKSRRRARHAARRARD